MSALDFARTLLFVILSDAQRQSKDAGRLDVREVVRPSTVRVADAQDDGL